MDSGDGGIFELHHIVDLTQMVKDKALKGDWVPVPLQVPLSPSLSVHVPLIAVNDTILPKAVNSYG